MTTLFVSSFLASVAYGQSFLNPSAPTTGSRPLSAAEFKERVNKVSQQYDSSINVQVKQMMPKPVEVKGQNVIVAPATTTVLPAAAPMPPPQTSVINQPAQYQPTTTFNPNTNNSFAPAAQAPQSGQPYTGFQPPPPATKTPANTSNQAPSWNVKY